MLETIFAQSLELTFWLQSLGSWLNPLMEFFTFLGNEEFYLFVMPVFIWVIDYRLGYKVGVMLLLTTGFNELFKMSFRMPRPYWVNPDAARFSSPAGGFGLPSGHSQNSLSIFGLLAASLKRSWVTAVVIFTVFMIGLSRIYLGEHFYIDVLAGWGIGGVVLYAFIQLEGRVSSWFSGQTFWMKTWAVFAYSVLVILMGAAVIAAAGDYQVPHDWLVNAHISYPEEPIEPLKLSNVITGAATLFGLAVGYFWVNETGGFKANSGLGWQRIVRFVIGLLGVAVLWMGLGEIFPDQQNIVSYLLRYLRYGLVGFWISGISPRLFIRTRLADPETE